MLWICNKELPASAFVLLNLLWCDFCSCSLGALRHSLQDRLSKGSSGNSRDEIYLKLRTSTGWLMTGSLRFTFANVIDMTCNVFYTVSTFVLF